MIQQILLTITGFAGMEVFSYLAHRFLFHGILWRIHQTHHRSHKFPFELNDIFSLVFALASIGLMISGNTFLFPLGLGIAIYGILYFIIHDFFTHRRFLPFKTENRFFLMIRSAHQRHHQSVEKNGFEPFGLFLFNFKNFPVNNFTRKKV